jgi:hypothetical protein
VFIALTAGLLTYAVRPPEGVSWVVIIILLFPAIVPSTPRKTLAVALIAASMDLFGALIWSALGKDVGTIGHVLQLAVPNYLCAVIATIISHIITRLGRSPDIADALLLSYYEGMSPSPVDVSSVRTFRQGSLVSGYSGPGAGASNGRASPFGSNGTRGSGPFPAGSGTHR